MNAVPVHHTKHIYPLSPMQDVGDATSYQLLAADMLRCVSEIGK